LTRTFLEGVRSAIPLAQAQIEVMLKIIETWCARLPFPPVDSTGGTEGGKEALRVLDLGCGDGILGRSILEQRPDAHLVLADFSEAMLDAARAKLGADHPAQVHQADFSSPGWLSKLGQHATFDLVVSGFAIHHQGDARKKALYAEIHERLSPGGVFLNLEHVASSTLAVQVLFDEYFIDHLYTYHRAKEPSTSRDEIARTHYNRPDKAENILAPVDVQCDWLREIGFQDVDCFFKVFELALFGGRKPEECGIMC
jgi:SAM-dependent methyltransferase